VAGSFVRGQKGARHVAREIDKRVRTLANPDRATVMQRFFKTGSGEYGEGDRFLGVSLPDIRALAREYRGTAVGELDRLLRSPWHETRLLAVIMLAEAYRRGDATARDRIYRLYLRRTDRINNWDLVDVTAPRVVGEHLVTRPRGVLGRLARSKSVWERRIAIIATQTFIRLGQFDDTIALARQLLDDDHDLIHKAVGWMLREVGNRDEAVLRRFLDQHASAMPRTALRYAIEKLPPRVRGRYLAVKRVNFS
jgi:3-methyladenine DNA glycosylase AlkD